MPLTQITTSNLDTTNSLFFRNRIINGDMRIDQRNAGASFTNNNTTAYGVDRWASFGITGSILTFQQVTDAPANFSNSFKCTVGAATTANDGGAIGQRIEANNCFDLAWGTASAQPISISFWIKSSISGQQNIYLQYVGSSSNQYYTASYTINQINTWEYKTINVPGCTTGGAFTASLNSIYMVLFPYIVGSSGNTSYNTANTWNSSSASKLSGTMNIASTSGSTIQITGVQLEKGTAATAFEYRPYGTELVLCQRYYETTAYPDVTFTANSTRAGICFVGATGNASGFNFLVPKRSNSPTVTLYSRNNTSGAVSLVTTGADVTGTTASGICGTGFRATALGSGQTGGAGIETAWTASAEL